MLAGSIRDDGPLPEVITDTLKAQARMREVVHGGVGFALLIATALHSIATGNLLPGGVRVVCVDINPATVTKLSDRGTFQTVGLVTDVEPFLRQLAESCFVPKSHRHHEFGRAASLERRFVAPRLNNINTLLRTPSTAPRRIVERRPADRSSTVLEPFQ